MTTLSPNLGTAGPLWHAESRRVGPQSPPSGPVPDVASSGHRATVAARAAMPWILTSLAALAVVQILALPTQSALRGTISGMVHAPGGHLLFAAMGACCATGSLLLARSLRLAGARAAAVVLGAWAVAIVIAALVPTDPPGAAVVSLASQIHRYSAVGMFVTMPLAGLLAGSALAGAHPGAYPPELPARLHRLRRAAWASVALGIGQLAVSLPSFAAGTAIASWPAGQAMFEVRGLAQRAAFLALFLVAARIRSVVISAAAGAAAHPTISAGAHRHGC